MSDHLEDDEYGINPVGDAFDALSHALENTTRNCARLAENFQRLGNAAVYRLLMQYREDDPPIDRGGDWLFLELCPITRVTEHEICSN